MNKQYKVFATILLAVLLTSLTPAHANTADDVVCDTCVNSSDIKNGAITEDKLAQSLLDRIEALEATVNTQQALLDYFSLTTLSDLPSLSELRDLSAIDGQCRYRIEPKTRLRRAEIGKCQAFVFEFNTSGMQCDTNGLTAPAIKVKISKFVIGHTIIPLVSHYWYDTEWNPLCIQSRRLA